MMDTWDLDGWTRWMVAAGRPASTISLRRYHVHRLAQDLQRPATQVTVDDLVDWLAAHEWSSNTRRSYRSSLRSFFGWLQASGYRPDSPAHLLPPVTPPRAKPRPTPELIFRDALAKASQRERLMVALAGMCGLRRGEVARVRREEVMDDLMGRSLRVVGKGGHQRMVPLPDWLAVELLRCPDGWVFPSPSGGHLTPHHVGVLVSRLMPRGWTCHTLRHRTATTAYRATLDVVSVQELLGHARLETTRIYVLPPDNGVRAAVAATA